MDPLDELVGHISIKASLKTLLKSPPSTLLFHGPKGVGKKTFALAFAKRLVQFNKGEEKYGLVDLREFFPSGKAALHSIASMKQLVDEMHRPPFKAKRKVFVLYEAHRMLVSSGNTLLKSLEEPPPYAHVILVTSSLGYLLKTLRSRAFEVAFSALAEKEIYNFVSKNSTKTDQEAHQIARRSQGNINRAKSLLEDDKSSFFGLIHQLNAALLDQNYFLFSEILTTLEAWVEKEKNHQIEEIFLAFYCWHRDLFILKTKGSRLLLSSYFEEEELKKELGKKLLDLEDLQKCMRKVWEGLESHIPLRHAFLEFFL